MGNPRETAFRILADEFNRSAVKLDGSGEYSPNYVVTPLGAKINRVFVVGVLTDVENLGTQEDPFFRAKVSDTTGHFFLSAGQYNPAAAAVLADISFPTFVAVVGKVRTFEPEDGGFFVSVNPEVIKEVDEKTRDYWCVKTAKATRERIEAYIEAEKMQKPDAEELIKLGFSAGTAEGAVLALEHYGSVDANMYFRSMVSAVSTVLRDDAKKEFIDMPARKVGGEYMTSFDTGPERDEKEKAEAESDQQEISEEELDDMVLEMIDEADSQEPGADGGSWEKILALAGTRKIERDRLEDTMGRLLDKGLIYEPVLGRMKKV